MIDFNVDTVSLTIELKSSIGPELKSSGLYATYAKAELTAANKPTKTLLDSVDCAVIWTIPLTVLNTLLIVKSSSSSEDFVASIREDIQQGITNWSGYS